MVEMLSKYRIGEGIDLVKDHRPALYALDTDYKSRDNILTENAEKRKCMKPILFNVCLALFFLAPARAAEQAYAKSMGDPPFDITAGIS